MHPSPPHDDASAVAVRLETDHGRACVTRLPICNRVIGQDARVRMPNRWPIDPRPLPADSLPNEVRQAARHGERFRSNMSVRRPRSFGAIRSRLIVTEQVVALTCFGRLYMYVTRDRGSVAVRRRMGFDVAVDLFGGVGEATAVPLDEGPVLAALESAGRIASRA
jgi:hypothetical protein